MSTFTFHNLIPDFCQIPSAHIQGIKACEKISSNLNPAEGVSAAIVGLLIFISVSFFIFSLVKFIQSRGNTSAYFSLIKGMNQSELAEKRRDIKNKAAQKKEYFGRLWREFDESLVLHRDEEGSYRLSNTLDAAHFFNTHSLARGLTENRLLAAVPGLLTAVGVIGTFAGLQMGLAGIDLSSDDVVRLKDGIRNMIQGASIAFLTSLWGIALSVLFNFSEKLMERSVRRQITRLQNHIDFLYPRINAEQSLVEIADTSKIGTETMQGLAEQIGYKMQEAMVQAGESISTGLKDSLQEILSPALEKMSTDAQTGSERALESMLERFMEGFGQAGENQRKMMNDSSENVQQAVSQLGTQMTQFMDNLDERSQNVEEQNRLQREQLETILQGYESKNDERQQKMAGQFEELMNSITGGVREQMNAQSQLEQERSDRSNEQINKIQLSQDQLGDRLESLLAYQQQSHTQLIEQLGLVKDGFEQVVGASESAAQEIKSSSESMKTASMQLSVLGNKIHEASESLGSSVESASNSVLELSGRNTEAIAKLDEVLSQYQLFASEVRQTSETLKQATEHAEKGFSSVDQHLQSFQQSMQKQVAEMEAHMQSLMTSFAEQVRVQLGERLQIWTDETSKFGHEMARAVNAIHDAVDDLESK